MKYEKQRISSAAFHRISCSCVGSLSSVALFYCIFSFGTFFGIIRVYTVVFSDPIFSTYDVNILLNGNKKGTMKHGENKDIHFSLEPGDYTITFESTDSSDVNGETVLTVDCDIEASYHISCHMDNVSVETLYIDRQVELVEGEIKLNTSADDFKFKDYTEVESALKEFGFSNIKYEILYDIVLGFTPSGEVKNVSIAGNSSFARGDVFPSDAEIIITYHMPENDDPSRITVPSDSSSYIGMNYLDVQQEFQGFGFTNIELEEQITHDSTYSDGQVSLVELDVRSFNAGDNFKPDAKLRIKYYSFEEEGSVFYSTNNYENAKKGNTGVFSYKLSGKAYDQYYIIDFDEGYVYYFTEGNGSTSCDKIKIASGTLNDSMIITYHDSGYEWSYNFHFHYVNHPESLIMVDNDGFDYKFITTDLEEALAIRNTRTIVQY